MPIDDAAAIDAAARTIGRVGRKSGEFWDWSGDFDVFSVVYTVDRGKLGRRQMGWDESVRFFNQFGDYYRRGYSRRSATGDYAWIGVRDEKDDGRQKLGETIRGV